MSLIAVFLALLATSGFDSPSHLIERWALPDLGNAYHLQRTVPQSEQPPQKVKWLRGRRAGQACGGVKNWRCAPGLYCEPRGTFGVCVRKKTKGPSVRWSAFISPDEIA